MIVITLGHQGGRAFAKCVRGDTIFDVLHMRGSIQHNEFVELLNGDKVGELREDRHVTCADSVDGLAADGRVLFDCSCWCLSHLGGIVHCALPFHLALRARGLRLASAFAGLLRNPRRRIFT